MKVSLFNKYCVFTVLLLFSLAGTAQLSTADQVRRSLVRVETVFGDCNGVLLRPSEVENRQLVLTARHCFDDNFALGRFVFGGLGWLPNTNVNQSSWNTLEFELLAESKNLDYALFELPDPIPEQFLPYAAGWNANTTNPLSTYGFSAIADSIVNFEDVDRPALFTNNAIEDFGGTPIENGAWWVKNWERGFTSTGSSGAALFDQWSRVVGVLSAGASTPEAPFNDFFSRMDLIYGEVAVQANLDPTGSRTEGLFGQEQYARSKVINYGDQAFVYGNIAAFEISEHFDLRTPTTIHGVYLPIANIDPFDQVTIRVVQGNEILYEQSSAPGELIEETENFIVFGETITVSGAIDILLNNSGSASFKLVEGSTFISAENIVLEGRSIGIGLLVDLQESAPNEPSFNVSPNPVRNNLLISGASENDEFRFLDTQGKEVFPRVTSDYQGRRVYNVDAFTNGIYLVILPSGEFIKLFVDN